MDYQGAGPLPLPDRLEPATLAEWLGAPVARLTTPAALCCYPDRLDETVRYHTYPVAVKIEHRFDSADVLDADPPTIATVTTRLARAVGDAEPYTLARHISESLFDYQLHSGMRAGAAWAVGPDRPRPGSPEILEGVRRVREHFSPLWVPVDGETHDDWLGVTEPDKATGIPLYGIGGGFDTVLIAVVGPADILGDIAVTMVQPVAGSTDRGRR